MYWWLVLLSFLPPLFILYYVSQHGLSRVPISDQWFISLDIAVKTKLGDLTPLDLTMKHGAHRVIWYNMFTALLTWANNWHLTYEGYLGITVVVIRFVLLAFILWKQQPALLRHMLIPCSILLFSLYQSDIWLFGFNVSWLLVATFFLMALAVLSVYPPGWKGLILTTLLILGATFSLAHGLVLWLMMPVTLWMLGYCHWQYYAFRFAVAGLVIGFYLSDIGGSSIVYEKMFAGWNETRLANPVVTLQAAFVYLNSPFILENDSEVFYRLSTLAGMFGTGLFAVNLYILWRRTGNIQELAIWTALAGFAVTTGLLMAAGRVHYNKYYMLTNRYINVAVWLWIALIGVMALNNPHLKHSWLRHLNYLTLMLMVVSSLLLSGFYGIAAHIVYSSGERVSWYVTPGDEACIRDYPLYRHCQLTDTYPELYLRAAAYRLNIFDEMPSTNILPDASHDLIIISTHSEWLNMYIREWMLAGIAKDQFLHIISAASWLSTDEFPRPLERVIYALNTDTFAQIDQFIGAETRVWLITVPEAPAQSALLQAHLLALGYQSATIPIEDRYYRQGEFKVMLFEK